MEHERENGRKQVGASKTLSEGASSWLREHLNIIEERIFTEANELAKTAGRNELEPADIANAAQLPVIIYNVIPWAYLSPQLLSRIVTEVDGVIGVKQSAGDLKLLADLLLMVGDRARIMTAVDALLYPSFALGAHGAIAAILTAVPTVCVELWNAVQAGDHGKARGLHEKLLPIWNAIHAENLPANVRCCMGLQGRCGGVPRPPMPPTSDEQKALIREALAGAGLID